MLIHNYGIGWTANYSSWGRHFRSQPVDFQEQIGIYVLRNKGKIVYVGQSAFDTIAMRIDRHLARRSTEFMWNSFSWFGFRPVANGKLAEATPLASLDMQIKDIEALMIYLLEPSLNKIAGAHRHIHEYEQVDPPNS